MTIDDWPNLSKVLALKLAPNVRSIIVLIGNTQSAYSVLGNDDLI